LSDSSTEQQWANEDGDKESQFTQGDERVVHGFAKK